MSPDAPGIAQKGNRAKNAPAGLNRRRGPRAGDVLASGRSARADIHAISVIPSEAHTIVARYAEAVEQVRELARRLSVDAWYTSDQTHYARVASYRCLGNVNESAASPVQTNDEVSR
jgi:hypothetical protein